MALILMLGWQPPVEHQPMIITGTEQMWGPPGKDLEQAQSPVQSPAQDKAQMVQLQVMS